MTVYENNSIRMLPALARNDLRARYSGSLLGVLWAFVLPWTTLMVFWYVFQQGFHNAPVRGAPYILWFSAAYVPWIFFADLVTSGCSCLLEYSFLVKKVCFNIYLLPAVKVLSALFVHMFFIGFLFIMLLFYGYSFSPVYLQVFYYSFSAAVLGLGLSWLLSPLTVFFKDMGSICNMLLQIGFWATPILWSTDALEKGQTARVLALNPMYYVTQGYRDCLLSQKLFWHTPLAAVKFWTVTAAVGTVGRMIFSRLQPHLADEV